MQTFELIFIICLKIKMEWSLSCTDKTCSDKTDDKTKLRDVSCFLFFYLAAINHGK